MDLSIMDHQHDSVDLSMLIVQIKCGHLTAILHVKKFVCPGIREPCIELDDCMISPKEFARRAKKDRQKDWKSSIRIGRSTLRVLMEMKALDFYRHDIYCSSKCQSRNYMSAKLAKLKELKQCSSILSYNMVEFSSETQRQQSPKLMSEIVKEESNQIRTTVFTSDPSNECSSSDFETVKVASGEDSHNLDIIKRTMFCDPGRFWSDMHELGIMNELVNDVVREIVQIKSLYGVNAMARPAIAEKLSSLINQLNLSTVISEHVRSKRLETMIESNVITNELQELQWKADDRRKKQEGMKRKSDLFDKLLLPSAPPVLMKTENSSSS